jgi:hypothetical protein
MTLRPLPAIIYGMMALGAFVALLPELFFGFGLWFAPGWANGWPGGLTIYRVWSAGMTACLFVMMSTIGVGAGGMIGLSLKLSRQNRLAELVVLAWLVLWTVLSISACALAYREFYVSTLEMWPNGYPGIP